MRNYQTKFTRRVGTWPCGQKVVVEVHISERGDVTAFLTDNDGATIKVNPTQLKHAADFIDERAAEIALELSK